MHSWISKISQLCQEICDLKRANKNVHHLTPIQEGQTKSTNEATGIRSQDNRRDYCTEGQDSNSSASKGTYGRDDQDDTYSAHSIQYPHK